MHPTSSSNKAVNATHWLEKHRGRLPEGLIFPQSSSFRHLASGPARAWGNCLRQWGPDRVSTVMEADLEGKQRALGGWGATSRRSESPHPQSPARPWCHFQSSSSWAAPRCPRFLIFSSSETCLCRRSGYAWIKTGENYDRVNTRDWENESGGRKEGGWERERERTAVRIWNEQMLQHLA